MELVSFTMERDNIDNPLEDQNKTTGKIIESSQNDTIFPPQGLFDFFKADLSLRIPGMTRQEEGLLDRFRRQEDFKLGSCWTNVLLIDAQIVSNKTDDDNEDKNIGKDMRRKNLISSLTESLI